MEELNALVARAQRGDRSAYADVVRRFQDMAAGYAYSLLRDFHLAQDAAQEAFIEAYVNLSSLRQPAAFPGWFRQIVFTRCKQFARARRVPTVPLEEVDEVSSAEPDSVEAAEERDVKENVLSVVEALPEAEREVVALFYIGEHSQREIGAFLSVPETTVKNRLRSARKRIRERVLAMVKKNLQEKAPSQNEQLVNKVQKAIQTFVSNFERVTLSPDASLVAYSVRGEKVSSSGFLPNGVPNFAGGSEVRVTGLTTQSTRVLTPGWGSNWGPRWSPDGRRLAFYSDRNGLPQIWVWDRETETARLVCEEPICVRFGFERMHWLPDGTRIVAKLRAPGWNPPVDKMEPAPSPRDVWVSPNQDVPRTESEEGWRWYDTGRGDIAVIEVNTGKADRLGTAIFPFDTALSPDGQHIAAMCYAGDYSDGNVVLFDLHLFAVEGSRHDVLARRVPQAYGTAFSWSPQSDEIAYTTYGGGKPGQLIIVSLDGRQRVIDGGVELGNEEGTPPLWSSDGQTVYCWANWAVQAVFLATGEARNVTEKLGREVFGIIHPLGSGTASHFGKPGDIVVVTEDRESKRQCLFRVGDGEPTPVVPEKNRALAGLLQPFMGTGCDADDRFIVGPIEDAANPVDLFCIDVHTGEERRLTALNPHIVPVPRATARLVSFRGPDGKKLQAALCLPPDYEPGRPHPTVVTLYYGAEDAGRVNRYLSSRMAEFGYIALYPDMPVSGRNPAETITALTVNAVDAVVEQGYTDPERVGLIGHSLGGYCVCCVITRTDRFRAAVATAPFTDLVSFALSVKGNTFNGVRWVEGGILNLGVTLWEDPQRYIDNSPVFHLHRVHAPLLLFHGTADSLSVSQSEEMYAGLLRLGKTAALVRYHGEDHVPQVWSPENYEDYWTRIKEWFDKHLRA